MQNTHVTRAQLLMQQHRYELAEQELRRALGDQPDEPVLHAMLALCMLNLERKDAALDLAQRAVHLGPDIPFCHYVLAAVWHARDDWKPALGAVQQAIALDPYDADHFSLLASIHIGRKNWQEALAAAQRGLEIDAEDTRCANMRAIALTQLGRRDEAGQTIRASLGRNPEDPTSHANMGWTLLHKGEPHQAMTHFAEALRLDPSHQWARHGIVEALKARNIIYRRFLRYALFMSRLKPGTQWALLIGIVVGINIVARVPVEGPLFIGVLAVVFGYFVFVLTGWIANPLFNLLLRLDKFGRMVLSDEEQADTNWLMLAIVVVGALAAAPLVTGIRPFDTIGYLTLMLAVGVTLSVPREVKRSMAALITVGLIGVAVWYCYGWVTVELPTDMRDIEAVTRFAETPEGEQKLTAFIQWADGQDKLRQVFVWGSAAMTWLGSAFHIHR